MPRRSSCPRPPRRNDGDSRAAEERELPLCEDYEGLGANPVELHRLGRRLRPHQLLKGSHVRDIGHQSNSVRTFGVAPPARAPCRGAVPHAYPVAGLQQVRAIGAPLIPVPRTATRSAISRSRYRPGPRTLDLIARISKDAVKRGVLQRNPASDRDLRLKVPFAGIYESPPGDSNSQPLHYK
jgi:hypothetical protein